MSLLVGAISLGLIAGCSSSKGEIKAIKSRGVLKAGVKVDVPKFGYKDPQTGKIDGFEIDIVRAIAKEILGDENKIELTGVNAQTRGPALDNGELDIVVATFTITEERKNSWNFSEPYFRDFIGLLVKNDGPQSWKDLNGKKVGVALSATTKKSLTEAAEKDGMKVDFLEFNTYPEIKAALDAGRVDAFSVDVAILLGYKDAGTKILDDKFSPQNYGVASKKTNTELAKLIDDLLAKMAKNGELDKLLAKWELK